MELTKHMDRLIISVCLLVLYSSAASGSEYVRDGWPGKDKPRLAARTDALIVYETPDSTSGSRRLNYKPGWLVVWDQSQVITRKSVTWTVKKEITKGTCGTLAPGIRVEFLQFENEGWGLFRVGENLCSLKATRADNFDKEEDWPKVEWWVRVLDNNKSPLGWLLVEPQKVERL